MSDLGFTVCVILVIPLFSAAAATSMRYSSHGTVETDADFDARYIAYFNNTDNDGWDIRNAMNTLQVKLHECLVDMSYFTNPFFFSGGIFS